MAIVLTGSKASGKTTVGKLLGAMLNMRVVETDELTEEIYRRKYDSPNSCREICARHGEPFFRTLEKQAVLEAVTCEGAIICTGGQTMMKKRCRDALSDYVTVVLLTVSFEVAWQRIVESGYPSYFPARNPKGWFYRRFKLFRQLVVEATDIECDVTDRTPAEAVDLVVDCLQTTERLS